MTKNHNRCNSRFNGSYRSYISISRCLIIRNKFNRHLNVAFISRVKLLLVQIYYCSRKESNYRGNRFCIDYLCFFGDFLSISIQKSVKIWIFFLVLIFPYSVRMRENTDQKKLFIWTLFMQQKNRLIVNNISFPLGEACKSVSSFRSSDPFLMKLLLTSTKIWVQGS